MPLGSQPTLPSRSDVYSLIRRVHALCDAASRQCGRAAALCQRATDEEVRSRKMVLRSRPYTQYARIEGVVDGKPTVGIVHRDGSVTGTVRLMKRVEVVVALGDSFADGSLVASTVGDPLVSTLTTTRACDRVHAVELFRADAAPPHMAPAGRRALTESCRAPVGPVGSTRWAD